MIKVNRTRIDSCNGGGCYIQDCQPGYEIVFPTTPKLIIGFCDKHFEELAKEIIAMSTRHLDREFGAKHD